MIKIQVEEYAENNVAIRDIIVKFFHIPIYKYRKTTTNTAAVHQLTPVKEVKQVIGFKDETDN